MSPKKLIFRAVVMAGLLHASISQAQDNVPGRCRTYHWRQGDIINVNAQINKQTHITVPEEALDVVWGPKELWDTDFKANHIFVNPRTSDKAGAETTATVIGQSGNTYEFRLIRVPKMDVHCVIIKADGSLISKTAWESKDRALQNQVQVLQQQLAQANADKVAAEAERQRQTLAALKSYRAALSSNYEWTRGSGWFAESGIENVQDDGRFTYIRLKSDNRGIMSVLANIDGQQEVLEKTYDASKREYRIAGVYPKFKLRAGESEITITRRGE